VLSQSDTELRSPSRLLAIAVFVALVVATLTAVVRGRPDPGVAHSRVTRQAPSVEPTVTEPMALVWVDAIPWGRIESITSPSGEVYPTPSPAETPLLLELPPGDWTVALSNPEAEEERRCELSLSLEAPANCRVEFERLSVDDYFREAGWWR
jgi:hypothetical protein